MATAPVLHLMGDWHHGLWSEFRRDRFRTDLPNLPKTAVQVQAGDLIEAYSPTWVTEAKATMALFPNLVAAIGNHDVESTPGASGDWIAEELGLPGKNQSVNLDFCQLIVLGQDDYHGAHIVLTQPTLDYLDAELTACAPRKAIVLAHAPLYNTVVGTGTFSSAVSAWFVVAQELGNATNGVRDQPIRDILAAHDNVLMWLSGHTHHPLDNSTLWTTVNLDGKHVIAGNASALFYTIPPSVAGTQEISRLCSSIVYLLRDRIEVRYRDHLTRRATTGPNGQRLTIIYHDDGLVVHERRAA